MNQFFTELGRTVSTRWKAQNFSLAAFPEIARVALEERPPAEHIDLQELIRDFLLNDDQPFQTTSGFGQPELVVYDEPRFYIQILFWLEGTTDIHQHMFSGAFHVMTGSSIHSHFSFENVRPVSAHVHVGDLRMTSTQLLETGSTVPIISGGTYVHSLFHLDTPSLTVVVRTHTDPGTGPQFTYLPPHMAVDPFHADALTTRRKQLLDVLEKTEDPGYADAVLEMIRDLDFERGFFILQNGVGHLRNLGAWDEIREAFEQKHGDLAKYVEPTLDEIIRRDALVELRGSVTEVEHRFFLALLLNVPAKANILQMVSRRFEGDVNDVILRWAEELTEVSELGTWILDAEFPPELEIDVDEQAGIFLASLRYFMAGGVRSKQLGKMPVKSTKLLREAFAQSSLRALVE